MAIKLSEESNKIITHINGLLSNYENLNRDEYMFVDDIKTIIKNIKRIKEEFESEMFLIASVGAIKSGKSTLINLLSHKDVSTTRQGKETTIRPAIISKGTKDEIVVFTLTGTTKQEEKSKAFDEAIDYIKGLISKDDLTKVKVTYKDYTKGNISKYLTEELIMGESDPMLVNVRVVIDSEQYPTSLLLNEVAIVDTPGIDGILAGTEGLKSDNVTFDLMNRIDMMLFLQSSITPINKESNDYIKQLKEEHKISNMRLVHNKFSLKEWRKERGIISDSDSDTDAISHAKGIFKHIVAELKDNTVDFAKAEDGYKYKISDLLEESGFLKFEDDLLKDLQSNRAEYKENRVKESFKNLISKNIGDLDGVCSLKTIKEKIKNKERQWEVEEKEYIDILDTISSFFANNELVLRVIDKPKDDYQEIDDGWELDKTIEYTKSDSCPQAKLEIKKGMKGNQILKELGDLAECESKYLQEILDKSRIFNNFILKSKVSGYDKTIGELTKEFNAKNTKIQLIDFQLKFNMEELCENINVDPDGLLKEVKKWYNIGDLININEEQIKELKEKTKKCIRKEAQKMVQEFQDKLKKQIKSQFANYCAIIEDKKNEVREILSENRGKQPEELKNTKEICQVLENFFKNHE